MNREMLRTRLFPSRISHAEQLFLMKRLAFLLAADIPLSESLMLIKKQSSSRSAQDALTRLQTDVDNGHSLSYGLRRLPHTFDVFSINMLRIGESSGSLTRSLEQAVDELKRRTTLRRKMLTAFVYPGVIALATLAITGFLVLYLFPRIMPIFASLHMRLPLTTRIVIALSTFLMQWGLLLVAVLVGFGVLLTLTVKRSEKLHERLDVMAIRFPYIGSFLQRFHLANASRTLGLLLQQGMPINEALVLTSDTIGNRAYRSAYRHLADGVSQGARMADRLADSPRYFPPVLTHMVAVGERSGTLSDSLLYIAELYETELEEFTSTLSSLVEPALMIVMGLIVGFVAVSIITPIYGITQNLHG